MFIIQIPTVPDIARNSLLFTFHLLTPPTKIKFSQTLILKLKLKYIVHF